MTLPGVPMGFLRSLLTTAVLVAMPLPVLAETATLRSPSGLTVSGAIIAYDGEFYRIDTGNGEVTIAGAGLACEGPACPGDVVERLVLSTSDTTLLRLAVSLLSEFATSKGWRVVETHDASGPVEIAMGDEQGDPRFVVSFRDDGQSWKILRDPRELPPSGWRDMPLAFDALVPAVSVENPVAGLTLLGLRAALAGEFPDWVGLGGGEVPVTVHWAKGLSGPLTERYDLVPDGAGTLHEDIGDAADAVARSSGGLGLLPLSEIGNAVPLVVSGPCGRGAIGVPTAIRTGDYPLSETVVLRHTARRPPPVARSLLDWLESTGAETAVRHAGFVDLAVREVLPGRDGRQEADPPTLPSFGAGGGGGRTAVEVELDGARRLDVAIRFRDGSSLPDRSASIQIDRIARAIVAGQFDGNRLILAGFSDANGAAAVNLRLSQRRAEAIRAAILAEGGGGGQRVALEARGFGETMPVACNGVGWGESLNRRVEVWLAGDES